MKAARIHEYGDPSVIKIQDIATPSVNDGKVLVEVHAASLNPFDTSVRSGRMKDAIPLQFPATLGGDIAGVVTGVGAGVSNVATGDKVYGQANVVAGNSGAFAEYALTGANQVALMPSNLDFQSAASLPLVGLSALQSLVTHINLQPGQKLFIHGGAGGIGTIAIQLAKHLGATVATTATGEAMGKAQSLGADQVIDYKAEDFSTILTEFDAVFDTVGGNDFTQALKILRRGGIAVSMIAQADQGVAAERGVTAITQATKTTSQALDQLRELVESGAIKPQVSKVFPLNDVAQAFRVRESGGVSGKVVLAIR